MQQGTGLAQHRSQPAVLPSRATAAAQQLPTGIPGCVAVVCRLIARHPRLPHCLVMMVVVGTCRHGTAASSQQAAQAAAAAGGRAGGRHGTGELSMNSQCFSHERGGNPFAQSCSSKPGFHELLLAHGLPWPGASYVVERINTWRDDDPCSPLLHTIARCAVRIVKRTRDPSRAG